MEMFGLLLFFLLSILICSLHRAMMDYFEYMIIHDREPPKKSRKKINNKQPLK